tara:strand:+ start:216 stop:386 length:171 start_codon:yes stop_codon:yes gene_type:complete
MNTEQLVGAHSYHNQLQREIDDAEWIGEADEVDYLILEARQVKQYMDAGEQYYPLF